MTELTIHLAETVDFLVGLLNTPSPSGYHIEAVEYLRAAFTALEYPGLSLTVTPKGALLLKVKGKASETPIGLAAHTDTLGLMVKEIKSSGRLKVTNIGGLLWGGIEAEGVIVRTQENRHIRGCVMPENTSVHVNLHIQTAERNGDLMEIRLDERVTKAEETRALGIEVGDFIFIDPRVEVSPSGFIRGRFLDDKAGVAAIYGALRALQNAGLTPPQDTYILITTFEEVGHGGAHGFPPNLTEMLVVDMGAIGVGQTGDEYSVSLCIKDAGGPYHWDMNNKLRRIAKSNNIPLKGDIFVSYASDGTVYWRSGGAAKVGLIGPGVDASHAYERTHQDALQYTAQLAALYIMDEVG